ncbi:MAG: response regulator transcription factor [Marvinbryantia sp.]|jgi:two-component system response regulator YesN
MRVIIAEDEKRASRGLHSLLLAVSEDCEVVAEAADGQKAFELIKILQPDVVFTDIRMPYMDGIDLIRAVRSQGMDTKFVIISAYEEFNLARQAIALGVIDYLVKPLTLEDIQKVWERLEVSGITSACAEDTGYNLKSKYPDAHPLILKALNFIECSYATKISQRELAEKLGISAEYFSFLFSRDIGANFARFLKEYRIEKAKELLDEGSTPTDQIPYSVGFSDPKYFYKCFKEVTGMKMTEYKRTRQ